MIRNRVVGWLGTALLLCLTGCAGFGGGAATTAAAPQSETYETVRINYRADSARLAALAVPRSGAQLAGYDAGPPPCSLGTLEIRYPHPRLGADWALVLATYEGGPETPTTALESTSLIKRMWSGAKEELPGLKGTHWSHEKWALDIPKWQLDRVVAQVRESGFFRTGHVAAPDIFLAAQVDGLGSRKNWKSFGELDSLLLRAREQGQLVAQTLPPGSQPAAAAIAQTAPPPAAASGYFDSLARSPGTPPAGYPASDGWAVGSAGDAAVAAPPRVMRLPEVR